MRGVKGTTGTQASFLSLFDGDHDKVKALDKFVCNEFGFKSSIPVSGQTYTRKIDYNILVNLSMLAQSAYKFAQDIRLLQSRKEMEEPFSEKQIGSSAMAIVMGEAFLAADAVLELLLNVTDGLVVYEKVINAHIREEIPFMATESILMECVRAGGNRQELHEKIRTHSMLAEKNFRMTGKPNDLIERLKKDPAFAAVKDFDALTDPKLFIGRAPEQVDEFLKFKGQTENFKGEIKV